MAYGTRRFNAAFTRDLQKSLYRAESNQFLVIIPIYSRSILTLPSHLRLGLPKFLFPVGFTVKILKALLPSSILATWPPHPYFIDIITLAILGKRYKLWSSSLFWFLHSPFTSFLGPNIHLSILFSNTLSLDSSLNVRDHVSQSYRTTGNIIGSYILIFKSLKRTWEDKTVWTWKITRISCFKSGFYLLVNGILISQ